MSVSKRTLTLQPNNFFLDIPHQREEVLLGIDAEIVGISNIGPVYPHQKNCPQVRNKEWVGEGYDWHGDGFAWEVCTQATRCIESLLAYTSYGLSYLRTGVRGKAVGKISASFPAVYQVSKRVVDKAPDEAKMLGCAPSFNVYNTPGKPQGLGKTTRTTGCHLHYSTNTLIPDLARTAVKWCDVLVGCYWTMISPIKAKEEAFRRTAYGRAGEHRLNTYSKYQSGFEYRVLPGTALANPQYLSLVLSLGREACRFAKEGEPDSDLNQAAVEAINNSDRKLAREVFFSVPMHKYSKEVLEWYATKNRKFGSWDYVYGFITYIKNNTYTDYYSLLDGER